MVEIWKDVVGYEGIYQVSNLGNVKRIKLARGSSLNKIMKAAPNRNGYPRLSLCKNNRPEQLLVHRLVAAAFIGPCPEGYEVNHIDGKQGNPRANNLEYVTSKENSEHATQTGLMPFGTRRTNAKLNDVVVREIRQLRKDGLTMKEIGKRFNVSRRTIGDVVNGKMWTHVV
jgi:hypothetical protein